MVSDVSFYDPFVLFVLFVSFVVKTIRAASTSSQTELRLTNVARASLEELLLDYGDSLRRRHLAQWLSDSPEAMALRRVPQCKGAAKI